MCIYTVKKQKLKIKLPQGECATPSYVPKLGVSCVKDTTKTNKDRGMSCYIQVEYSFFPLEHRTSLYDRIKIIL